MRPLTRASLGLLALAATAPAAIAGVATEIVARQMAPAAATAPAPARAAAPSPTAYGALAPVANAATVGYGTPAARSATICPSCLRKASDSNGRIPMPPVGARIGAVCAACQVEAQIAEDEAADSGQPAQETATAPEPLAVRRMPVPPVGGVAPISAYPPGTVFVYEGPPAGRAVVGGAPAPSMAANAMSAPGYAVVGGQPAPAAFAGPVGEPSPIGVVQAGYRAQAPGAFAPASARPGMPSAAPGYAATPGYGPGMTPAPGSSPLAPLMTPPPKHGSNFMRHLFYNVPSFSRMSQEKHERQTREAHAMMSYGPNGQPPSDLPAAMVYGR